MSRQSSSDPLPYVQVDRAVKPRAAMLADAIGVSRQHAMGSLIEWWDLCGDPRELERIVERTPVGEEPEVVLTAADAALRFRLASTREVEPVTLARIGLLEERADGRFRVRGMSRYFEPVVKRLRAREVAAAGGRASAEARRAATGSAQPAGGRGFDAGSVPAQPEPNRQPNRNRTDDRTETEPTTEAEPKPSGQRSAVSGQRPPQEEEAPLPPEPPIAAFDIKPPDLEKVDAWTKEDFWKAAELTRRAAGFPPERWPSPVTLSRWWGEAQQAADTRTLAEAFVRFTTDRHWRAASPPCPWSAFAKQYLNFLPSRGAT